MNSGTIVVETPKKIIRDKDEDKNIFLFEIRNKSFRIKNIRLFTIFNNSTIFPYLVTFDYGNDFKNNFVDNFCKKKIRRIKVFDNGCTFLLKSKFNVLRGVFVFDYLRDKTNTPHLNFSINSPIPIIIPIPIRIPPIVVISDDPNNGSIIFPPINVEYPNRINNGGVPYATTFPTSSIDIVLFAPPKHHIGFLLFVPYNQRLRKIDIQNNSQNKLLLKERWLTLYTGIVACLYLPSLFLNAYNVKVKNQKTTPMHFQIPIFENALLGFSTDYFLNFNYLLSIFPNEIGLINNFFYFINFNKNNLIIGRHSLLNKELFTFYSFFRDASLRVNHFLTDRKFCYVGVYKILNGGWLFTIIYHPHYLDSFVFADIEFFDGGGHE